MNTLTLTRVTRDMGATIKPGPMVVAPPEQVMTDAQLKDVAAGSDLNGPFIAELVVSMAAHENMAVNMFRALQNMTTNPLLKSVFADFEQDSLEAVGVHAQLMTDLGIPMYYVSPAARLTEGLDSHMIMSFLAAGSADPLTIDLKTVEAVLLGATMCVANTSLLRHIANEAQGPAKAAMETAITKLEGPQSQHLEWAQKTQQQMVMTLVKHPTTHKLMEFTEKAVATFKRAVGKSPV